MAVVQRFARVATVALVVLFGATLRAHAQWPQFRGIDGMGTSSNRNLPLTWSEEKNVRWKTAIHGRAWSSPVVLDNQVWVTSATRDGRDLYALALDLDSGKILYDLKLFHVDQPQYIDPFNSYASPTPVIEPGRVYVTFGSAGTAATDTHTERVVWQRLRRDHFDVRLPIPTVISRSLPPECSISSMLMSTSSRYQNACRKWKIAPSLPSRNPSLKKYR